MQRDQLRDWVTVTVRWGDMDAYRHVNNSRYFTYIEAGRIRFYVEHFGGEWQATPAGPVLASVTCNFREPVVYPATLEVGSRVVRVGRSSFELEHGLYRRDAGVLVSDGTSVVVWMDRATGKATPLDGVTRERLERLANS